jgi:hypothetical protein
MQSSPQLRSIRIWLSLFIAGLILSGITAFPLEHETAWLAAILTDHPVLPAGIIQWIDRVHQALYDDSLRAPFLAYGTDWLAFAHLVLAAAFIGPLIDPVRNKWVLQFGLIACAGVLALALIAGPARGIPLPWRLIDRSFGVFGAFPLLIALRKTVLIESIGADSCSQLPAR